MALRAEGLFGRTLLARDLTRIPSELLPGQRVRLTEPWRGAPQLDWGEVTLTASARDTRESASVSFFALPWLVAAVLAAPRRGYGAVDTGPRSRARPPEAARQAPPRPCAAGPPGSGTMGAMSARPTQMLRAADRRPHRAGFACFVGRPNAGKSTLTNALVGQKVAITSNRPQTTRHTVRGIVHRPDAQLILVDTPGLHKPRTLLGERLNDVVRTTWAEVDVIGFCLPADQKLGPGDRFIAKELAGIKKTPKIAIVTKTDLVDSKTLAEQLIADRPARQGAGLRVGGDRPGLGGRRTSRSSCSPTCSSRCCRRARRSTRRATSPTSPSRSWSRS